MSVGRLGPSRLYLAVQLLGTAVQLSEEDFLLGFCHPISRPSFALHERKTAHAPKALHLLKGGDKDLRDRCLQAQVPQLMSSATEARG